MAKRKSTKEQTTIYKTLHSKQTKDRVTQTPLKPGVNSSASEGFMFDASVSYNIFKTYKIVESTSTLSKHTTLCLSETIESMKHNKTIIYHSFNGFTDVTCETARR
jgi:hypothetical protein